MKEKLWVGEYTDAHKIKKRKTFTVDVSLFPYLDYFNFDEYSMEIDK